jgi:hypothetical protein
MDQFTVSDPENTYEKPPMALIKHFESHQYHVLADISLHPASSGALPKIDCAR